MSRTGKQPIQIPSGVTAQIEKSPAGSQHLMVSGQGVTFRHELPSCITAKLVDNVLTLLPQDSLKKTREQHGLHRALLANKVTGVSKGFERRLQLVGVGYRAAVQGNALSLSVGYSHPVQIEVPKELKVRVESNTEVVLNGADKELLGNICAKIRSVRPPEPYKGKGIRYHGEVIIKKAGKSGKK
jgi:large subunit ribosomal protein L6